MITAHAEAGAADVFAGGVIDAHHHLYVRPSLRYLARDYVADVRRAKLPLVASIYVQARSSLYRHGPEHLRVLGETEFALRQAHHAARAGLGGVCAGVVGAADLTRGAAVRDVLERHVGIAGHAANGGRFCGIRHVMAWDADSTLLNSAYPTAPDLMWQADFRQGLHTVADMGLAFDAWVLAPQLPGLVQLARAVDDLAIVLNHCGGPVGIGAPADSGAATFDRWCADISALARCERVSVKFGGLGMALSGLRLPASPGSAGAADALAALWRPHFDHLLSTFGPDRMMLESNAPADRPGYPFALGWRAFSILLAPLSATERDALCRGTARRVYDLSIPPPPTNPDKEPST